MLRSRCRGSSLIFSDKSPLVACKVAARVLFGMVVRERRRVASLARTASSLDEKAIEAEKCASIKDAALRSYIEEERRERETMAQSQQEQILSLMAMVQEQETVMSSNGEYAISADNSGADEACVRIAEQKQSLVNARVMVLANERINALQNQVEELQAECKALEAYKEQEAEARSLLLLKEEETDGLQKELNSLRSSLRQIRQAVSMQSVDEVQDNELSQAVLGIVMNALHPSRLSQPSSQSKKPPMVMPDTPTRRPKIFSPRLKRHVELMHTSDSEEDGEIPEWAGDIMKDLAIIAEDKVPPSLRDIDASKGVSSTPTKKGKVKSENVFDRLTNPESFTGVQKRKTARQKRANKSASIDIARGGQEERLALSRSVTESLEKVVIPEESARFGLNEKQGGNELFKTEVLVSATSSGKSDDSRSVFDRLLSPSNYTGTQKDRAHHKSGRQKEKDAGEEPDALLDELLGSDDETRERASIAVVENAITEQIRPSKVSDYTQQDVFERLQRTTTQSYAVKHSHLPVRSPTESVQNNPVVYMDEVEVHEDSEIAAPTTESTIDHSEYYRQNVFERLQKTTTQAYAKKTKSSDK